MPDAKRILWVDDEISGLKSHILFLEARGFDVRTAPNGEDALAMMAEDGFDAVLLVPRRWPRHLTDAWNSDTMLPY